MSAPDHYAILGLAPRLSLDSADVQQRFYRLSRKVHPDRFSLAAPAERARAEEATAALNDAYRTLRDPVARAEYFLGRQGFEPAAGRQAPAHLLEEVFELREALEELRAGDSSARPRIEEANERLRSELKEGRAHLRMLFEKYDRDGDAAVLGEIRAALDRRKYVDNLVTQVESELGSE